MTAMVERLKGIGAALGTISALAYVTGYLVLRARAHALGLEPALDLVEEAYVFAGFRFLYASLVWLLWIVPACLVVRLLARPWSERVRRRVGVRLDWTLLALLLALTMLDLQILDASAVLLEVRAGQAPSAMGSAVLGDSSVPWRTAASMLLPALTVVLFYDRLQQQRGPFEGVLGLLLAVQVLTLPIQHGALSADRGVRVLSRPPAAASDLLAPVAVVDRTGKQVTLYSLDGARAPRLTVLPTSALDGVGVTRVARLRDFVRELGREARREEPRPAPPTPDPVAPPVPVAATQLVPVQSAELFALVGERLQITFDAIGSLGDSPVERGEIWRASFAGEGAAPQRQRVGTDGDLRWPVAAAGGIVYALRGSQLVTVTQEGSARPVACSLRWRKLLGVTAEAGVAGLVAHEGATVPAVFADGLARIGGPAVTSEEKAKVARLLQDTRAYAGGERLQSLRSERGGRGFDVMLTRADGRSMNVSDCGDDACGQAALIPGSSAILYVRSPRY
jgi:hypothetical protein